MKKPAYEQLLNYLIVKYKTEANVAIKDLFGLIDNYMLTGLIDEADVTLMKKGVIEAVLGLEQKSPDELVSLYEYLFGKRNQSDYYAALHETVREFLVYRLGAGE